MTEPVPVAVVGAAGRMGQELLRAIHADTAFVLAAAVVRPGHPELGRDSGEVVGIGRSGIPLGESLGQAAVAVEFTGPAGFDAALAGCLAAGVPLVSGSTALDATQMARLEAAASRIPVLWAPNMSLGVAILGRLVEHACRALGVAADVEIVEAHHRFKKDAPSGTGLALARRVAEARGQDPAAVVRTHRDGAEAPRVAGEIGVAALRAGDIVGEHTVLLGLDGERLELTHRAQDRRAFVRGALAAARFLVDRPPGTYRLDDLWD